MGRLKEIVAGRDGGDHAGVVVRPPVLFAGMILAALFLEFVAPLGPGVGLGPARAHLIGVSFIVLGAVPFGFAMRRFLVTGTNLSTWQPSLALVESGPYTLTRNPIYIGLLTIYFGIAVALTSGWALFSMPIIAAILHYGVVLREEVYLSAKFGDAYRAYQARVPRWF